MPKPAGLYTREDWPHVPGATVEARRFGPPVARIACDAVIVGSGSGGAVVAAELAEAGLEVVVLEEGGYFPTESFNSDTNAAIRNLYRDGGLTVALGDPPLTYVEGRCVGGSTVINGGMTFKTPDRILQRWAREDWVEAIDPDSMIGTFGRVERFVSAAYQDPWTIGLDNKIFKDGADKKGWETIPNIRNQLHCAGSNNCAWGCPTGAKRSTLVTYLPRALHYGARVLAHCRVDRLRSDRKRVTGVSARVVRHDGSDGIRVEVRAPIVVLSAGAIHTPAILHRSGIRSPSGRIGKNLWMHPNAKLTAVMKDDVRGWEGVHQAYQIREFQGEGILFAAINLPPSVVAMTSPYHGRHLRQLMGDYERMLVAGVLLEDTRPGRLRMIGGRPQPFYTVTDLDVERAIRGMALLSELLFEVGAERIVLPFEGLPDLTSPDDVRRLYERPIPRSTMEFATVHLMGTCAMGGDRARHVCDSYGRVYDVAGLWVADASLFPSPIGVNPMETIMALATRNAESMLKHEAAGLVK